jgi:AraC-like DNA-binding protein
MKESIKELLIKQKKYRDCEYSQAKLAADIGVDVFTLSRNFKKMFGMTYTMLIYKYRVKDAIKLLSNPKQQHVTMDDIALLVGFGNRQTFYTAFRKETGLTPDAYRREELKVKS